MKTVQNQSNWTVVEVLDKETNKYWSEVTDELHAKYIVRTLLQKAPVDRLLIQVRKANKYDVSSVVGK